MYLLKWESEALQENTVLENMERTSVGVHKGINRLKYKSAPLTHQG